MCESNVYFVDENGNRSLVMESVDKIKPVGDEIHMENILNKKLTVKAEIAEMSLVDHLVLLKKL